MVNGGRYNAGMLRRLGPYAANALTGLRILLTPVFVVAAWRAEAAPSFGIVAAGVFGVIAASDVWDGRVARRFGSESRGGRVFDHFADIAFIVPALSAYAALGIAPWWVPAAVTASFAFYVLDSWSRATAGAASLIGSRIGHAAGVLNYSLIGVLVCNNSAGMHLLSGSVLTALYWFVPVYSAAAVAARLATRHEAVPVRPLVPSRE